MKHLNYRCLILNSDFSPLALIDWKQAITLDFKGTITTVDFYKDDAIICSSGVKWPIPAVAALRKYTHRKVENTFSRKNIFMRDRLECAYCHTRFKPSELTYDHVIPRAKWDKKKGTPTCWTNIVTCCYPCNSKKGDKTLKEAKMTINKMPEMPKHPFVKGIAPWTKLMDEWKPWLPPLYLELCQNSESGVQ